MSAPITVVVPVHDGAPFLRATLDSLAAQSPRPRVVVVDDGSADQSREIAGRHPVVDLLLEQPNAGVAVARNRGLAQVRSPWVAFLDQDDLWHPDRSAMLLDLADRTGRDVVGTSERLFARSADRSELLRIGDSRSQLELAWVDDGDELAQLRREEDPVRGGTGEVETLGADRWLRAPGSWSTSFLVRTDLATAAGGFPLAYDAMDDHVFHYNVARLGGGAVRIDHPAFYYRVHPAARMNNSSVTTAFLAHLVEDRLGSPRRRAHYARSEFIDQLVDELPGSGVGPLERLALTVLTTSPDRRLRRLARSTRLAIRRLAPRDRHRA
ncbi:glycosyltransferase [Flexivirga sp. ID2601S]|uniref:Glycosyltransferase n=1 Tax=Flexivirga aerilata TaxID=1656889 RepID=A0A849AKL5_9MICO|nr:glycosyltransferase [Flexivirga aerilata]